MTQVPKRWRPMMREAGIAVSSLYSGLNSLRKANYAEQHLYDHAFFGISIGLERLAKLAILVHSRTTAGSGLPTKKDFRETYSHDLYKLFDEVERLRTAYVHRLQWNLPNRAIAISALGIISDFATKTRYYNLDVLLKSPSVYNSRDPIDAWYSEVAEWILENKYSARQRRQDEKFADHAHDLLDHMSSVKHVAEDGTPISNIGDGARRSRQMDLIQRESVVICACLARHISELLWELESDAMQLGAEDVPYIHEFFSFLYNEESFFRKHKVFVI